MDLKLRYCIIFGVLVFICAVAGNAPARLISSVLGDATVYADNFTGTLWRGRATGVSMVVGGEPVYLEQLDWNLHLARLLLFSPAADFEGEGPGIAIKGEVSKLGDNHWRLRDSTISFPAELLGVTSLGQFAGSLNFQIAVLEIEDRNVRALEGRGFWQSARWFFDQRWWVLGNFASDLSAVTGAIAADIYDQGGPIGIKGRVKVQLTGSYDFSGDIMPRQDSPQELRAALSIIGEQQSDASYRVGFKGQFPAQ